MQQLGILSAFSGQLKSKPTIYQDVYSLGESIILPYYDEKPYSYNADNSFNPEDIVSYTQLVFKFSGKKEAVHVHDLDKTLAAQIVNDTFTSQNFKQSAHSYSSFVLGCLIKDCTIYIPVYELESLPKTIEKPKPNPDATKLLRELYVSIIAEAEFDSLSPETEKFSKPLAEKMHQLNALMGFYESVQEETYAAKEANDKAVEVKPPVKSAVPESPFKFSAEYEEYAKLIQEKQLAIFGIFGQPQPKYTPKTKVGVGGFIKQIEDAALKIYADKFMPEGQICTTSDGSVFFNPNDLAAAKAHKWFLNKPHTETEADTLTVEKVQALHDKILEEKKTYENYTLDSAGTKEPGVAVVAAKD